MGSYNAQSPSPTSVEAGGWDAVVPASFSQSMSVLSHRRCDMVRWR